MHSFGQQCQQTVLGLFTNGSFSQCFPATALLPRELYEVAPLRSSIRG